MNIIQPSPMNIIKLGWYIDDMYMVATNRTSSPSQVDDCHLVGWRNYPVLFIICKTTYVCTYMYMLYYINIVTDKDTQRVKTFDQKI